MKRNLNWLNLLVYLASLGLSGCGLNHLSRVQTYPYPDFDILVAYGPNAPDIVDQHCRKGPRGARHFDDGKSVKTGKIAACTALAFDLIPTYIVIPEQFMIALPHELCHALKLGDEAYCMEHYPTVWPP